MSGSSSLDSAHTQGSLCVGSAPVQVRPVNPSGFKHSPSIPSLHPPATPKIRQVGGYGLGFGVPLNEGHVGEDVSKSPVLKEG